MPNIPLFANFHLVYSQFLMKYSYYYYISIDYGDGKGPVSKETSYGIYYTAEMPGAYLMGQVDDNGNRIDFELYPTSEYEKEN